MVLLISMIFVIFGSCATAKIAFDESLSDSEIALIHWYGINITEYNGISVDWKMKGLSGGITLRIPGGDTMLSLNGVNSYRDAFGNRYSTRYNNVPFKYHFENGKEYTVMVDQHMIRIYTGRSASRSNRIVTYNMRNGQTLVD